MEKIIILKYGELSTKKDNINFFLKTLKKNIDFELKDMEHVVKYDHGRMFIKGNNLDLVMNKLNYVFGIQEIMEGYIFQERDIDVILRDILDLIKDKEFKTFKVISKRSDKTYKLNSMEINAYLGGQILKNVKGSKVDVHNPDLNIYLEIRNKENLIYFNGVKGLGGYPVNTLGKGLLMLSGGIDSPVSGYLAIKRGIKIECLYFESPPHTSVDAKNKVMDLAKVLSLYNLDIVVHVINFTKIQESILKNAPKEYLITIMRRMMYRISEEIAKERKCDILINGESIGQVASQTLKSMKVINEVVKIPVIRPVSCFDKLEIIDLAKRIKTYDISIRPYMDCCTIFVPEHPIINPNLTDTVNYEKNIPWEDLVKETIINKETIRLTNKEENKFQDLL
jgi:thiamine biosynthesis protein ThiI